jgi:hypothetical protein
MSIARQELEQQIETAEDEQMYEAAITARLTLHSLLERTGSNEDLAKNQYKLFQNYVDMKQEDKGIIALENAIKFQTQHIRQRDTKGSQRDASYRELAKYNMDGADRARINGRNESAINYYLRAINARKEIRIKSNDDNADQQADYTSLAELGYNANSHLQSLGAFQFPSQISRASVRDGKDDYRNSPKHN